MRSTTSSRAEAAGSRDVHPPKRINGWPRESTSTHGNRSQAGENRRREDVLSDRILRAAGYTVLRFTDVEIEHDPTGVIARLRAGA